MPKVSTIQISFSGGEISPLAQARVDIPRYKECLAICLNYVPTIQGPKTRRPGTLFVGRARNANKKSRMFPFIFSTTQSYSVEFSGAGKIRFYKNGTPVVRSALPSPGTPITGITKANPAVFSVVL
jgi:hypothetical protein